MAGRSALLGQEMGVITERKGQIQEQEEVEVSRWCHNLRREVEWVSPGSEKGGCRNSR
jgi:hypothetical protein